jgi:hypothetical protein
LTRAAQHHLFVSRIQGNPGSGVAGELVDRNLPTWRNIAIIFDAPHADEAALASRHYPALGTVDLERTDLRHAALRSLDHAQGFRVAARHPVKTQQRIGVVHNHDIVDAIHGHGSHAANARLLKHILGPGALNSFRATLDRVGITKFQVPIITPSSIGVQNIYGPLPSYSNINITGDFQSAGGFATPGLVNTTTYQFNDDFSLIKGSHQMQFGANYIRPMQATTFCVYCNGLFTFNGQLTGNAMADFISGSLGSFTQINISHDNEKWNYIGLYAQDNWKVNGHVTVNYGLRWEPLCRAVESHDPEAVRVQLALERQLPRQRHDSSLDRPGMESGRLRPWKLFRRPVWSEGRPRVRAQRSAIRKRGAF